VYVADVASAILAASTDPAAIGETYELVGPTKYTMNEVCEYVGETIREPMWTVGLPSEVRVHCGNLLPKGSIWPTFFPRHFFLG
jgi:uncharacterized protein YbjT (DUF2867 family)